jgi:hypothetical protein
MEEKPHEESWRWDGTCVSYETGKDALTRPRARLLAAAAPDMARALLAVRRIDLKHACWCHPARDVERVGHEEMCEDARAALTKAGVPLP